MRAGHLYTAPHGRRDEDAIAADSQLSREEVRTVMSKSVTYKIEDGLSQSVAITMTTKETCQAEGQNAICRSQAH